MPALEILDFSKNELSSLPEQPGHLVKLKVLSLTSNKIHTLPSYLVEFAVLKVFKVDQNPVEWPVCHFILFGNNYITPLTCATSLPMYLAP